jgi:asparagine synthase (glutamine-hydrolysing)
MCGIWAYIEHNEYNKEDTLNNETRALLANIKLYASNTVASRGPDKKISVFRENYYFVFHRLAIHDLTPSGDQPFLIEFSDGTKIEFMCNGEIYNYKELLTMYSFPVKSQSDCEIIGYLMYEFNYDIARMMKTLRGEFSFIARVIKPDGSIYLTIGRDAFGVRPLYYGVTKNGLILSSTVAGVTKMTDIDIITAKALENNEIIEPLKAYHFPPGHFFHSPISAENFNNFTQLCIDAFANFKNVPCKSIQCIPSVDMMNYYKLITDTFIHAVKIRLDSERDVGFFLSGGLDSSLVVAVATKFCGVKNARTFSIGFDENAPDLEFAWKVADHLSTNHTPVIVDTVDALNAISNVIQAIETYDITTIRASTPQYLLASYIKECTDIKVILNGDGSDEVSMGYIYNYYAPDDATAHADSLRLLSEIHRFDGLRVDRTLGAHGLEARLPFLDVDYVEAYLSIPVELRRPTAVRMEKQILRDAFNVLYPDMLPYDVLYRKKEAFSDGVSTIKKSWFSVLKEQAEWINKTEKDWYKDIFDASFPDQEHIRPHYWMPQWTNATDPSARTLSNYKTKSE